MLENDWALLMAERWLLTGGSGQVGLAMRRNPPAAVELFAPDRGKLDLSRPLQLDALLDGVSAIVNCAAYTAVDNAESEPELAARINAGAPGELASAACERGIPLIHVSTDYVFSPCKPGPWLEDSPTAPGNVYGRTKLEGEIAVRGSGARHAIIRTAWIIGADRHNFAKTMLRLGQEREVLSVVSDQLGCPTHAGDLSAAIGTITRHFTSDAERPSGTWHCTNSGETTWHGLATQIFGSAAKLGLKVPTIVHAIATTDYPTPARRPADSRLDCTKLVKDFGISLRPWQEAVDAIVARLASQGMHT